MIFQSTLPVRGATAGIAADETERIISIHAPREGSDFAAIGTARDGRIISIHAPREGSDDSHKVPILPEKISIHAPREGSDSTRVSTRLCL